MFSLKKGFLIARVENTKVYITEDENQDQDNQDNGILSKIIELPKTKKFTFLPPNDSFRLGVAGPSGAGKSTFVASVIEEYKKIYKKNKVFMVSPTKDDDAYSKLPFIEYIRIDETLIDDPIDFREFTSCLIIFDDSEVLSPNKKINEAIEMFRNQLLENGRKLKISTIAVNHIAMNGAQTKKMLNECQLMCVFPKSNFAAVKKLAEKYWGFDKAEIEYLRKINSRWVLVKNSYPQAILSERQLKLV